MEKEQTETHPMHVASLLRRDAAAWVGAITLWLYLATVLTTRGYLGVFNASPAWFNLSVFQLTSFSVLPLSVAVVAATGNFVSSTSRRWGRGAKVWYLVWAVSTALALGIPMLSSNPYNSARISSWWGRYGAVFMLLGFLIAPFVLRTVVDWRRQRILMELEERLADTKSLESSLDDVLTQAAIIKGVDETIPDLLNASERLQRVERSISSAQSLRLRITQAHAEVDEARAALQREPSATPREAWVAVAISVYISLVLCVSIGQSWALLSTSEPPRTTNLTTGALEEILLTDGERTLSRRILNGKEQIVYQSGDREWVLKLRDASIELPATRMISSSPPRTATTHPTTNP